MDNMEPSTGATPLQDQALAVQSAGAADGPCQRQLAVAEAKRLLMNLLNVVSIMVVGHLGEVRLAGVSLAISLANVTGYIVLTGMATALDTLCGQAFGAGQHGLLCIYTQRTMVVLALACVPIVTVWAGRDSAAT